MVIASSLCRAADVAVRTRAESMNVAIPITSLCVEDIVAGITVATTAGNTLLVPAVAVHPERALRGADWQGLILPINACALQSLPKVHRPAVGSGAVKSPRRRANDSRWANACVTMPIVIDPKGTCRSDIAKGAGRQRCAESIGLTRAKKCSAAKPA